MVSHRANAYWFFVPIFAPFIGAVLGVMVYQLMVGYHVEGEAREKKEEEEKEEQDERLKLSSLTTKDSAWVHEYFTVTHFKHSLCK